MSSAENITETVTGAPADDARGTTPGNAPEAATVAPEGDDKPASKNAEAAKWRVAAREAQAERDELQARLDGFLRADAERLAAEFLAVPGDLFDISGASLADVLDEDGRVSPDKIKELADAAVKARPGLAAPGMTPGLFGVYGPSLHTAQGATGVSAKPAPSWATALRG
ncbi:hypothetical protein [Streptomyces sp. BRA346]|uniref:hypothetical protein n=1 Tax=Streptomyces sp. BRA346 TaxID=2878199 RepID=UPI004062C1C5